MKKGREKRRFNVTCCHARDNIKSISNRTKEDFLGYPRSELKNEFTKKKGNLRACNESNRCENTCSGDLLGSKLRIQLPTRNNFIYSRGKYEFSTTVELITSLIFCCSLLLTSLPTLKRDTDLVND